MQDVRAFRPRSFAVGLISLGVLIWLMSMVLVGIARYQPRTDFEKTMSWLPLIPCLALDVVAVFFAATFVTMKYFVADPQVILRCGPFQWKIPIADIRSIVEKDVSWMPISEGWKLPGYALFKIECAEVGPVRMCGTALTKRILLIQTGNDLWGITPADVEGFVAALHLKPGK